MKSWLMSAKNIKLRKLSSCDLVFEAKNRPTIHLNQKHGAKRDTGMFQRT